MTQEALTSIDGVSGHTMADTPSALDDALTREALDTIEFAETLERVSAGAVGLEAKHRIRQRRPVADVQWIRNELADVEELTALFRRGIGPVAEPTPPVSGTLKRLRVEGSVLSPTELSELAAVLVASARVHDEIGRISEQAPRASRRTVSPLPPRFRLRLEQSVTPDGEVLDSASPALQQARRDVHEARRRLIARLESLLRESEAGAGASVTVREGRYVIPVRRSLRERPDGIVHDESASHETLFIEPTAAIPLGNALREAVLAEERAVLQVLRDLTNLLRPEAAHIALLAEMCVALDELIARARWAVVVDGAAPEMRLAPAPITILNGRHPLLLHGDREVIPFTLSLGAAERTLLITGPNTGGKTVLLKAVAVISALAQSGIIPPVANGTALQVCTRFAADVGDRQSIAASLSTFSAHMRAVVEILDVADAGTLVVIDEIGSGTDPMEGAALAAATLLELTDRGALSLITTHLGELKSLAAEHAHVVNGSLAFDTVALSPTYRFQKGVPGRSYGVAIARRLGLPDHLLAEAERRVPEAERNVDALLSALEERQQRLAEGEERVREADARLVELEERLTAVGAVQAARQKELSVRERSAERDGRRAARQLLLDARKTVEETLASARATVNDEEARAIRRTLESAVERETGELEEVESELKPTFPSQTNVIEVGDSVRSAGGLIGVVTERRSNDRLLVQIGSVKMTLPAHELRRVDDSETRPARPPARPDVEPPGAGESASMEVDLRGLTGDEAEAAVLAALDAAVVAAQPSLRVIHGMGTGVVRERVQALAASDRRVRTFAFAPRRQGGTGVTIVEFK